MAAGENPKYLIINQNSKIPSSHNQNSNQRFFPRCQNFEIVCFFVWPLGGSTSAADPGALELALQRRVRPVSATRRPALASNVCVAQPTGREFRAAGIVPSIADGHDYSGGIQRNLRRLVQLDAGQHFADPQRSLLPG